MCTEAFGCKVYNYTSNDSVLGQGWGGRIIHTLQRENSAAEHTIVSYAIRTILVVNTVLPNFVFQIMLIKHLILIHSKIK